MDRKVGWIDLSVHRNSLQRIHGVGDLDSCGTSDRASITRCADPDRLAAQDVLQAASSEHRYRLSRRDVHKLRYRAGSRAGSALKALLDLVSIGKRVDLLPKCGMQLGLGGRKGLDCFSHKTSKRYKYSNSEGNIDLEYTLRQQDGIVTQIPSSMLLSMMEIISFSVECQEKYFTKSCYNRELRIASLW